MKKYITFNEELKFVRYKDLDNWDPKDKRNYIENNKKLNLKKGQEFIDIFEKHGITVSFGSGELSKSLKFGKEKELKDVRIGLYLVPTFDSWIEDMNYDESDKDNEDVIKEYEYDIENHKSDEIASFSVFMGSNQNTKSLVECMSEAYDYLKNKLNNINIYEEIVNDYSCLDDVSDYASNINFEYNNKNLEIIPTMGERLRKDSKVFYFLKENMIGDYNSLVKDLKKL